MEIKNLAASLINATATIFAARLEKAEKDGTSADSVTVDTCANEVFTTWRSMVERINRITDPGGPESFLDHRRRQEKAKR
jgi:hypothetical protein